MRAQDGVDEPPSHHQHRFRALRHDVTPSFRGGYVLNRIDQVSPVVDFSFQTDPRVAAVIRKDGGDGDPSAGATWELVLPPLDGRAAGRCRKRKHFYVEARVQEPSMPQK